MSVSLGGLKALLAPLPHQGPAVPHTYPVQAGDSISKGDLVGYDKTTGEAIEWAAGAVILGVAFADQDSDDNVQVYDDSSYSFYVDSTGTSDQADVGKALDFNASSVLDVTSSDYGQAIVVGAPNGFGADKILEVKLRSVLEEPERRNDLECVNIDASGTLAVTGNGTLGGTLGVTGALTGSSTVEGTALNTTGGRSILNPIAKIDVGSDWTELDTGIATLATANASKTFSLQLGGLEVGRDIESVTIYGEITEVGSDICTLDADLDQYQDGSKLSDIGAITQQDADGTFTAQIDLSGGTEHTIAADEQLMLNFDGSTSTDSGSEVINIYSITVELTS